MNWLRYRFLYWFVSALILVPGVWSLFRFGLKPAVDFTGGSRITFANRTSSLEESLRELLPEATMRPEAEKLVVQTPQLDQAKLDEILARLNEKQLEATVLTFDVVGPSAGQLLLRQTLTAATLATVAILLYISSAFRSLKYGLSAILAMLHDMLVLLGSFSLLGTFAHVQVDLLFVTALLTTLSFSVHDTIVLFDRVRELSRRRLGVEFDALANQAITDTMIRSLNNSMTIIFMLLALILLGGESIRVFVGALLIGAITGTYSSPFVAMPLLSLWHQTERRFRRS